MILSQIFKTFEGACKRASFENTHSKTSNYFVWKLREGEYRLEKLPRSKHVERRALNIDSSAQANQ